MKGIFTFLLFLVLTLGFAQGKMEVFFDFNKDVPNELSVVELQNWMVANSTAKVTMLSGYCDSVDVNSYNKDLSERRINSVLGILRANDMSISEEIQLKPMGENFSLSKNQSENRRVDIFFIESKLDEKITINYEITTLAAKFTNAVKGDIVRIENINFYLNSETVMTESEPLLRELLRIMEDNPKLKIEIHGHICCNLNRNDTALSYRRAKYIFTYLLKRGVSLGRLGYKGFGSAAPIFSIPEQNEDERIANRRVEIKITEK